MEFSTALAVPLRLLARPDRGRGDLRGPVGGGRRPPSGCAPAGATLILNLSASDEMVGKADYRRALVTRPVRAAGVRLCLRRRRAGGVHHRPGLRRAQPHCGERRPSGRAPLRHRPDRQRDGRGTAGLRAPPHEHLPRRGRRRGLSGPTSALEAGGDRAHPPRRPQPLRARRRGGDRAERCDEILRICRPGPQAKRLEHTDAKTAVVGLSGGLDSTLAILITAVAFDLLGRRPQGHHRRHHALLRHHRPHPGQRRACWPSELGATPASAWTSARRCDSHFRDIGQSMDDHSVTFENGQARERTQVLMDMANQAGGLVIGTGDLSELALGWATYNGDHMSMYGVNASIPKTLVRHLVAFVGRRQAAEQPKLSGRAGRYSGHPRLPGAAARRGRARSPRRPRIWWAPMSCTTSSSTTPCAGASRPGRCSGWR